MGAIQHAKTKEVKYIGQGWRVGRAHDCNIRLLDQRVSSEHACFIWQQSIWTLRDLGSRNGTRIDEGIISRGATSVLREGSVVSFGCTTEEWILTDPSPPDVSAVCLETGEELVGVHGFLELVPGVRLATEDGRDYWILEEGERHRVENGALFPCRGRLFRLSLPMLNDHALITLTSDLVLDPSNIVMRINLSRDMEDARVELIAGSFRAVLRPSVIDDLLVTLGRTWVKDAQEGLYPSSEWGWLHRDQLATALDVDVAHINVDLYRCKRRFSEAGVSCADAMFETRPRTGTLRLACGRVEITEPFSVP